MFNFNKAPSIIRISIPGYLECVRNEFRLAISKGQETYGRCISPWMMNFTYLKETSQFSCNRTQLQAESDLKFMTFGRIFDSNICPGKVFSLLVFLIMLLIWIYPDPCTKISYQADPSLKHCNSPMVDCNQGKELMMFPMKMEINRFITIYKVNFNTFISSVGGSLGLFLGFSIRSTLFGLYGKIENQLTNLQRKFKNSPWRQPSSAMRHKNCAWMSTVHNNDGSVKFIILFHRKYH